MLTRKQKELLDYLTAHAEKSEVSPSFDEMRDALGLASKSGIHRLVSGLEERGYIRRLANRARAIEILKPVSSAAADFGRSVAAAVDAVRLPLLGKIAAGTPIEALSDPSNQLEVPASMLGRGEHFALEIVGDSMMEAGILDGDTVVIALATADYPCRSGVPLFSLAGLPRDNYRLQVGEGKLVARDTSGQYFRINPVSRP